MDKQLFNQIADTLKAQFPDLPDKDLLEQCLSRYDKEIQRRQQKNVYEVELEKADEVIDEVLKSSRQGGLWEGLLKGFFPGLRP